MKPRVVAIVAWFIAIANAARQGYELPMHPTSLTLQANWTGLLIVCMPFIFFSYTAAKSKQNPFDVKPLRQWVDQRYGTNTYLSYLQAIQPLLLFASAALVLATVGTIRAYLLQARAGAFFTAGFFLSGAAGAYIWHLVLRSSALKVGENGT